MKTFATTAVLLGVLAVIFFAFNSYIYDQKQAQTPIEPYEATLTGTLVCLPHKDTSGPQTMECASGLKTDVGEHYALDTETMPNIGSGERFTAIGIITPVENLSAEQKYDIVGVFSVSKILEEEPVVETPVAGECYVGGCSSQLCTDKPDMVSTCEYRSEYACYAGAVCERQQTGACGWTETAELRACLENPPAI